MKGDFLSGAKGVIQYKLRQLLAITVDNILMKMIYILMIQVVVLLLVLSLCSVEGMRKRKKNRQQQQQGRRGDFLCHHLCPANHTNLSMSNMDVAGR